MENEGRKITESSRRVSKCNKWFEKQVIHLGGCKFGFKLSSGQRKKKLDMILRSIKNGNKTMGEKKKLSPIMKLEIISSHPSKFSILGVLC
jgi:hypothetical protein